MPQPQRSCGEYANVDALSRRGDRYSIKGVLDSKKTGTVYPDATNQTGSFSNIAGRET